MSSKIYRRPVRETGNWTLGAEGCTVNTRMRPRFRAKRGNRWSAAVHSIINDRGRGARRVLPAADRPQRRCAPAALLRRVRNATRRRARNLYRVLMETRKVCAIILRKSFLTLLFHVKTSAGSNFPAAAARALRSRLVIQCNNLTRPPCVKYSTTRLDVAQDGWTAWTGRGRPRNVGNESRHGYRLSVLRPRGEFGGSWWRGLRAVAGDAFLFLFFVLTTADWTAIVARRKRSFSIFKISYFEQAVI